MKTIARIATAAVAALVSVFVAAPAFAAEEEHGHGSLGAAQEFSTAGDPLQVGAILIVGIVLLAIVLIVAPAAGSLFDADKKRARA